MKKKLLAGLAVGVMMLGSMGLASAADKDKDHDDKTDGVPFAQLKQQINELQKQLDALKLKGGIKGDKGDQGLQGITGPAGPKGDKGDSGGGGNFHAFDANGQYLGIVIGDVGNGSSYRSSIYLPSLQKFIIVNPETAEVLDVSNYVGDLESPWYTRNPFYYASSDCTGTPLVSTLPSGSSFIVKYKGEYYTDWSDGVKGEAINSRMSWEYGGMDALGNMTETVVCVGTNYDLNKMLSDFSTKRKITLPFTEPLALPLTYKFY